MRILTLVIIHLLLAGVLLGTGCSQAERTEGLDRRLDRMDDRQAARAERWQMRSEASDRDYDRWFNSIMN